MNVNLNRKNNNQQKKKPNTYLIINEEFTRF